MSNLLAVVKVGFAITLFGVFVGLFALPNISKYLDDESMVIESHKSPTEAIAAPLVTLCPNNPRSALGWKDDNLSMSTSDFFASVCGGVLGDPAECVRDKTYSLEESIFQYTIPPNQNSSLQVRNSTDGGFETELTFAPAGLCRTFRRNSTILSMLNSLRRGGLSFTLNSSTAFMLLLSDHTFTYFSLNVKGPDQK